MKTLRNAFIVAFPAQGECYVVTFTGPRAEERAREYAQWKNGPKGGVILGPSSPAQISDALALENLAFNQSMSDAAVETAAAIQAVRRDLAARGLRDSGHHLIQEMEIRLS
jgi:hypothetical protein